MLTINKFMLFFTLLLPLIFGSVINNVLDHGAVGDGETDDTNSLLKAWKATCDSSSSSYATMKVPANSTFLVHPLLFKGPCKPIAIRVEINGMLTSPSEPKKWRCGDRDCDSWIHFSHVDDLVILGSGTISGRGEKWWNIKNKHKPAALRITNASDVKLSGLRFKDNPRMHIIINGVNNAYVSGLNIEAPGHSPNTDGIHIGRSTNVTIENCKIRTGDDCISIGGGSSNLTISNIRCGPGHGISIGSLGKHGNNDKVEDIHVTDVVFTNTTNGARIKTWQGGIGYARNIIFERVLVQESKNPIIIDQYYCDHEKCVEHDSAVKVSHVTFREVLGTSDKETAVKIDCSKTVPCEEITLENIYLRSKPHEKNVSSYWSNARGTIHGRMVPEISFN